MGVLGMPGNVEEWEEEGEGEGEEEDAGDERGKEQGWLKKRVNKIRSAEMGPRKLLKKIKSDPVVPVNGDFEVGSGNTREGKGQEQWKDSAKILSYFRASLATPIG